ncbi:MAG: hypothetical protein ACI91R_001335 [Vicingaceae bacterium]|jgi:hypothetical protein
MQNTLASRRLRHFGSYLKLRKTCLADFVIPKKTQNCKAVFANFSESDDFDEAIKKS